MSDISLQLPDPRQYPESSPSNMLIHYTQSIVNARSEDDRAMWRASLRAALVEMLEREELLSLSVALAMVTSQQIYRELWDALRDAAERPDSGRHAVIFAVPLVLVIGSKGKATLPERIADVDTLNALFRQHGLFADGAAVKFVGEETFRLCKEYVDEMILVDTDAIARAVARSATTRRAASAPPPRARLRRARPSRRAESSRARARSPPW